MLGLKSILVFVDPEMDSSPALTRAARLAKANGAKVTVFSVVEPMPRFAALLLSNDVDDFEKRTVRQVEAQLEELAATLRDDGLDVTVRIVSGRAAIEIIREVLRRGHDLVVKSADGSEPHSHVSHRDMQLLRKCPATVWLVRAEMDANIQHVLAPVDPEPGDSVRNALNSRILRSALAIANDENAKLDVLRAWQLAGTTIHLHALSDEELDRYMDAIRDKFQTSLDEFLEDFEGAGERFQAHLVKGAPETRIPEWVKEHNIDLIVMGTVARTGVAGLFIGNTAERVLPQVPCSIVALKPEGFRTPVELPEKG